MGEARRRKQLGIVRPSDTASKKEPSPKYVGIGYGGYKPMMFTALAIAMMESSKKNTD